MSFLGMSNLVHHLFTPASEDRLVYLKVSGTLNIQIRVCHTETFEGVRCAVIHLATYVPKFSQSVLGIFCGTSSPFTRTCCADMRIQRGGLRASGYLQK